MYTKAITRVKKGWKCIIYTSVEGCRYTTIYGDTLSDLCESIEKTIRDYTILYQEKGYDYDFRSESEEFKA